MANWLLDALQPAMENVVGWLNGSQQQVQPQQQMLMPDASVVANAHPYDTGERIQQANPYDDMVSNAMQAVFNYAPGVGAARDAVIANRNQDPAALAKAVGSFATDMIDWAPAAGGGLAMLIGKGSPAWTKMAKQGPYDDVPLGAYSSRYFEKGAGPQVEVYNPTSLASNIEELPAKRGKLMEKISPTPDVRQYEGRMKHLINDPVGYAAYPEAAHNPVKLTLDRKANNASGATYPQTYDPGSPYQMSNRIEATAQNKEQLLEAAAHEKSHPRGRKEWGAIGGDPIGAGSMETYLARPGEIYARTEAKTSNVLPQLRAADIEKGSWPNTGLMWVGDKQVPVKPFWDYADMPPELSGLSIKDLSNMQQAISKGKATPEQKQMDQLLKMLMK